MANVRGETIPYIRLSEYFEMAVARPEREQIMVVETEDGHYGFVVDEVLGNHQTVIKNLGRLYRDVSDDFRRHHPRERNRGADSRSAPAGADAIQATAVKRRSALHALTQKEKNPCYVQ
jgi:hypothetical protein